MFFSLSHFLSQVFKTCFFKLGIWHRLFLRYFKKNFFNFEGASVYIKYPFNLKLIFCASVIETFKVFLGGKLTLTLLFLIFFLVYSSLFEVSGIHNVGITLFPTGISDTISGRFLLQTRSNTTTVTRHHCHHFPTFSLEHLSLSLRSNLALHSLLTLS
jgi:hypothetical protein